MKTFVIKKFDELSGREVYEILKARSTVFMMEQNIHYLDMDDVDYFKPISGGKIIMYVIVAFLLLLWILL